MSQDVSIPADYKSIGAAWTRCRASELGADGVIVGLVWMDVEQKGPVMGGLWQPRASGEGGCVNSSDGSAVTYWMRHFGAGTSGSFLGSGCLADVVCQTLTNAQT